MRSAFLLLALLMGCPKPPGDALRSVRFEGNDTKGLSLQEKLLAPQTDQGLRNAMAQPEAPNVFSDAPPLNRDTLDEDAWRIEVWYANHGYFDARFLGWALYPRRTTRVDGRFLGIQLWPRRLEGVERGATRTRWSATGYVDQGQPSRIRKVEVRGLETLMAPTRARLLETLALGEGDIWSVVAWQETLDGIRAGLLDRSYAHVDVGGHVDVHPEEHAVDATIEVTTGPRCRFGPITIVDTSAHPNVPERLVRNAVTVKEGEPFNAKDLSDTRARLFALRVFGVVDVVPDVSDPTSNVVPVRIELRETAKNELRIGPIASLDTSSGATVAVSGEVDSHNMLGMLVDGHTEARAGYAWVVNNASSLVTQGFTEDQGPVGSLGGTVRWPFSKRWSLGSEGGFEAGIQPGYRFWSADGSPVLTWSPTDRLSISVGPRIRYFRYYDYTIDLAAIQDSPLGLDIRAQYLLTLLEQHVSYDGRNDPMSPTRGWYGTLTTTEAGAFGDYQYLGAQGELRAYRSIVRLLWWDEPGTVVAGRLGGGILWPFGAADVANVPIAERLYLGGGTSVRGWGAKRLGPYVETADTTSGGYKRVPVGGELSTFGSFELRQHVLGNWGMVAFVDAGRVWNAPKNFDWAEIEWSVGGGLRYTTPIGPVRVDGAVRLGNPKYFAADALTAGEPRVTLHLGLSEAF